MKLDPVAFAAIATSAASQSKSTLPAR